MFSIKNDKSKIVLETDLITCPGCGKSDRLKVEIRRITFHDHNSKYRLICIRCGWAGPEGKFYNQARDRWNKRKEGGFL